MKILKIISNIILFPFKLIIRCISNLRTKKLINSLNINDLDKISGVDFENILAYLFSKLHFKVDTTPVSGDFGADLILQKWKTKIVVQCKLYYNHSVGNKAIYEVNASKSYYDADVAIAITNHKYSTPATQLADKLNVILIDRNGVKKLLTDNKKNNLTYLKRLVVNNLHKKNLRI